MACENEKVLFETKMAEVQKVLKSELDQVAGEAEQSTRDLSDKFKDDNNLAQGVGAVAGTVIGGVIGGAGGAVIGEVVGKAIGSLFVIELGQQLVEFSLDLPEFALRDEEFSLDLPEVTVKDNDIIFNLPTLVMKTVEGPPVPEVVVEMRLECIDLPFGGRICSDVPQTTVRWKPTFFDVPTFEDREQRIVIGIPEVTMKPQKIVVGVPQVTMKTQALSFTIPTVAIRFAEDAGKQIADEAKTIATDAASRISQKQAAFRERLRQELVGPAHGLFECHRGSLVATRDAVAKSFNDQLATISNSLVTLRSNNVPETDDDFVAVRKQFDDLVAKRDAQLAQFEAALSKLDEAMKKAIDQMVDAPAQAEPEQAAA